MLYNPVNYAYALVGEGHFILYIDEAKLSEEIQTKFALDGIVLRPYLAIYDDLKAISGKVLFDERKTNYALYLAIKDKKSIPVFPTTLWKAIKNETEIANTKNAQLEDAVAMVKFQKWLKENVGKIQMDEISVADKLEAFRRESDKFIELSFDTICGYMANGAVIHYSATPETNERIFAKGLLLVDSGAQYRYGTTDITRTFALGELTPEMRHDFTLVLKAHIALSSATFKDGTLGTALDEITRALLKAEDKDYMHGTGHGVGHYLNVHEDPNGFSWDRSYMDTAMPAFEEGMLTSDEPGYYEEGAFGIRHESLLLCLCGEETEFGQFMEFENVTMVPIDLEGVVPEQMQPEEIEYLNRYHQTVFEKIGPLLNEEEREWLREATRAV